MHPDAQALLARVVNEKMPPVPPTPSRRQALGERIGRMWLGRAGAKSPGKPAPAPTQSARAATGRDRPRRSHGPKSAPRVVGRLLRPFVLIAQIILVDVSFKRDGKALHIVIARRRLAPPLAPVSKAVAEAEPLCGALKRLLDLHPMTRRMMRHLGYFESELAAQGLAALAEIPIEVMSAALEQLDAIVTNWSDRHLADLRSRMAVALKERTLDAFFGPAGDRSNYMSSSRLLVDDVSHSQFLELERQYLGLIPQDTIQSALSAAMGDVEEPVTFALNAETGPSGPQGDTNRLAIADRSV
jgi:hypothetical protein